MCRRLCFVYVPIDNGINGHPIITCAFAKPSAVMISFNTALSYAASPAAFRCQINVHNAFYLDSVPTIATFMITCQFSQWRWLREITTVITFRPHSGNAILHENPVIALGSDKIIIKNDFDDGNVGNFAKHKTSSANFCEEIKKYK